MRRGFCFLGAYNREKAFAPVIECITPSADSIPDKKIAETGQFRDKRAIAWGLPSACSQSGAAIPRGSLVHTSRGFRMWISVVRRVIVPVAGVAVLAQGLAFAQLYHRTDLTANSSAASSTAPNTDPNLVNAWGIARGSGGPWWVSDNGTGLTTVYTAGGAPFMPPGASTPLV